MQEIQAFLDIRERNAERRRLKLRNFHSTSTEDGTMHWLLDVHFGEDFCRVEDENIQQNLNMLRKLAINAIKQYKAKAAPKRAVSKIMLDCLLDPNFILKIFQN